MNHPPDNMPTAIPQVPAAMDAQAVSASISLIKVVNWDGKSQDINQVLTAAFDAEDYLDCIKNLRQRNIDPQSYIDGLDKVSPYSIQKHHAWFTRFGDRSSTTFQLIQNYGNDACGR